MRKYEVLIMESKDLNRDVKVYIMLPDDYQRENLDYPVLYVHDGNVVFNDFEEATTSWGMLDNYIKQKDKTKIIIIGVASGETRNNELFPFEIKRKNNEPTGGMTNLYMNFIIEQLKPYIDQHYRTRPSAYDTGMLGVSVGGAATIYAAANYQDTFSRFGFVSSCHYPVQEQLLKLLNESDFSNIQKIYSDIGTEEHEVEKAKETYLRTNKEVYEVLQKVLEPNVGMFKIIEGSKHEFEYWNKRFPEIVGFLFGESCVE